MVFLFLASFAQASPPAQKFSSKPTRPLTIKWMRQQASPGPQPVLILADNVNQLILLNVFLVMITSYWFKAKYSFSTVHAYQNAQKNTIIKYQQTPVSLALHLASNAREQRIHARLAQTANHTCYHHNHHAIHNAHKDTTNQQQQLSTVAFNATPPTNTAKPALNTAVVRVACRAITIMKHYVMLSVQLKSQWQTHTPKFANFAPITAPNASRIPPLIHLLWCVWNVRMGFCWMMGDAMSLAALSAMSLMRIIAENAIISV